jgi:phosphatidylinositol-3-phosphatase
MAGSRRFASLIALAGALLVCLPSPASAAPPIRHVFVIVLENESYSTTFGAHTPAPYLARTLPSVGARVPGYYGIGHASLDNYVAMISGQAPNPQTQSDCQQYTQFFPGITGPDGQAVGQGCVYPTTTRTVANQLEAHGLTWRGYMQDMGADPTRESSTCAHPPLNSLDHTQAAEAKDQYATRHDPFVYFHSIIDSPTCKRNVVPLTRLRSDLASARRTPNLVFITPDLCNDGHDAQCADGGPGGLRQVNTFLRKWAPRIVRSRAFRKDGLLALIFDESDSSDSGACCGEQPGVNTVEPGIGGPGGGRTGAVLISRYIRARTVSKQSYNHYSLLRSIEDLFKLPHLGYAGASGLRPFGSDIFTSPRGKVIPKLRHK